MELLGSFVAGPVREASDKDRAVGGYGKYPESSESKSLKLYLNGFANERIHSEEALVSRVCDDLQEVLGIRPEFALYSLDDPRFAIEAPKGICIDNLPD